MVKQAEKRRNRSPFLPVLGLLLAVVLFAVAWASAQLLVQIKAIKSALNGLQMVKLFGTPVNQGQIMLAFMLWLVFLAIAYFLVAVLSGKDPESTKDIPMPQKNRKKSDRS